MSKRICYCTPLTDQMLLYYQGLRKSVRQYEEIGSHYLEVSVFHDYCLHAKYENTNLSLLGFRPAIAKNLFRNVASESILHRSRTRYFGIAKPDQTKKYARYKCRFCSSGKSSIRHELLFFCETCSENRVICIDLCFKLFHEKLRNKVSDE